MATQRSAVYWARRFAAAISHLDEGARLSLRNKFEGIVEKYERQGMNSTQAERYGWEHTKSAIPAG